MRESTRAVIVLAVTIVAGLVTYFFFFQPFMREEPKVQAVINANSTWSVAMQEYEQSGLLSGETYRISNDNGKTTMFYAGTNRAGTITKEFSVPLPGPQGTFLYEELRADGIWDVDDRPVRPHSVDRYIIEVDQTLGDEGGNRSFSFSDPQYWATTHAQEFRMHLPRSGPVTGANAPTLGVAGRSLQDARYWQIVKAIRAFGPPNVLDAEAKIRAQLIESAKHPVAPQ